MRRNKQTEAIVSKGLSPKIDYSKIEFPKIICKVDGRIRVEEQKSKGATWYAGRTQLLKRLRTWLKI